LVFAIHRTQFGEIPLREPLASRALLRRARIEPRRDARESHPAHRRTSAWTATHAAVILAVLGLVELSFTASLIVIVIFSGYENFVSRIDETEHKDWPEWMGKIDFTGLKLKLMSSIVAISAIQLLRAFMNLKDTSDRELAWTVGIHIVFVVSAVLLALSDRVSAQGRRTEDH
jgi:uncharacterized protein (TIGR00645 family)